MTALLLAVLVLVLLTAALTVSTIGTQSTVSFLLGLYVGVWVEVVSLALLLSLFNAFDRVGLLIGSTVAFAAAVGAWIAHGRPRRHIFRAGPQILRSQMADPVLLILAATAAVVVAYGVVLGVATPQNEWDSLSYHLARAAFWIQQASISYVSHAPDIRINGNPPNAEIGQAWTMLLGGGDRFVWLPAMAALPALMLGVYGIARRAGLEPREALFGALVFGCLPLVVLQSPTAMNDLVVASFFVAATYFAMGTSSAGALGAGLSLGLAFGTKISAPLLLPVYLFVVLAARRRRLADQCVIVILGISLGAFWYVVNLAETRALDGGMADATGQRPDRQPALVLTRAFQLLLDTIELPGVGTGRAVAVLVASGAVLVVAGIVAVILGRRRDGRSLAAAGTILLLTPLLLVAAGRVLSGSWRIGWAALGRDDLADQIDSFELSTLSDSSSTWYGPIGALLIFAGVLLAARAPGNGRLRVALAVAPLAFIVVLAASVPWDPWRGRFLVFPMALAAAVWGLAYRVRALAWATVGLTVVTVVLTLATSYTKPPGLRLLDASGTPSVFGKPRWRVQTWTRDYDGTAEVVAYFEKHVPSDASVGLSLRLDDFSYPYFGADRGRTVRFLAPGAPVSADDDWIIEAPDRDVPRCAASWETALETESGFHVLRRTAADSC